MKKNEVQIKEFSKLLIERNGLIEIRILNAVTAKGSKEHVEAGYFDDPDKVVKALLKINRAKGFYVILNKIGSGKQNQIKNQLSYAKGNLTGDQDIVGYSFILLDFDAKTKKQNSATDKERANAEERMLEVKKYLQNEGFSDPIVGDSGNGYHLLYPVDLPTNDAPLVKSFLKAISDKFSDSEIEIDKSVGNPGRMSKLYGTVACKGENTEERPHRLSRLVQVPEKLVNVPREKVEQVVRLQPKEKKTTQISFPITPMLPLEEVRKYIRKHCPDIQGPKIWQNKHELYVLPTCPFDENHTDKRAYLVLFSDGALIAKCFHKSCTGKSLKDLLDKVDPEWRAGNSVGNQIHEMSSQARKNHNLDLILLDIDQIKNTAENHSEFEYKVQNFLLSDPGRFKYLAPLQLLKIKTKLEGLNVKKGFLKEWYNAAAKEIKSFQNTSINIEKNYLHENDCTYYVTPRGKQNLVANFRARIDLKKTYDSGVVFYRLCGKTSGSADFSFDISDQDYADDRTLKMALLSNAGHKAMVQPNMAAHLRPSISSFSDKNIPEEKYSSSLGWHGSKFLIPGRPNNEIIPQLNANLVYEIDPNARLDKGIECLQNLIETIDPKKSLVLLAFMFQGPLARFFENNKRYFLFVTGMTGSFKTSISQLYMCLYGPKFIGDDHLLKFGEGSTNNALNKIMTYTRDVPILIDNFKLNTIRHEEKIIALIHNVIEGGQKRRMNKKLKLEEPEPILTWPLCTGEDLPSQDPATLARMINLEFDKGVDADTAKLSKAQDLSSHLTSVLSVWLDELEKPGFREIIVSKIPEFEDSRTKWRNFFRRISPSIPNISRLAENFALNEITLKIMAEISVFKELLAPYIDVHSEGLKVCARSMASLTADGVEAEQFLEALRELIMSGKVKIVSLETWRTYKSDQKRLKSFDTPHDGVIGFEGEDGYVYIIPKIALDYVQKLKGLKISERKLGKELDEGKALAKKASDSYLVQKKIYNVNSRYFCLHKWALGIDEAEDDAA